VLPHWVVDAVCLVAKGAMPSYAHGYYERDNAFYRRWDSISRDRDVFQAWLKEHVIDAEDFSGFLRVLGESSKQVPTA